MSNLHVLKDLPHSLEAERAVLGAMMVWNDRCTWSPDDLGAIITPEDFYREAHGKLFELMMLRYEEGLPIEMFAMVEAVLLSAQPAVFGGASYISSLADKVPSTENALHYAGIVVDAAANRRAIHRLRKAHDDLVNRRAGRRDVLDELETWIGGAGSQRTSQMPKPIGEMVRPGFRRMQMQAAGRGGKYITSGIRQLDEQPGIAGLSTIGVTYIIANVGIGKTMFANSMVIGQARDGLRVGLYGTETNQDQRFDDLALSMAGINQNLWSERVAINNRRRKDGKPLLFQEWFDDQLHTMEPFYAELENLPIVLFERGWTVERICGTVRRLCRQGALDCFVLDYLQDINHSPGLPPDFTAQTVHKSKMLKETQSQCHIPFAVTAQAKHFDQHPTAGGDNSFLIPQGRTIQYSSAVHKDGEEIWALHRRDYWTARYPDLPDSAIPGYDNTMTVAFRKRRIGGPTTVHVDCHKTIKWVGER